MITGRIVERFRERVSDWFCAAYLFIWGATLLHPNDAFSAPVYAFFRQFGETKIGWLLASIGLLWLRGLIITGSPEGYIDHPALLRHRRLGHLWPVRYRVRG